MRKCLFLFASTVFVAMDVIFSPYSAANEWCPYIKGKQWDYKYWVERSGGGYRLKESKTCAIKAQPRYVKLITPIGKGEGRWLGGKIDKIEGTVYFRPPLIPLFSKGTQKSIKCFGRPVEACGLTHIIDDYMFYGRPFQTGDPLMDLLLRLGE